MLEVINNYENFLFPRSNIDESDKKNSKCLAVMVYEEIATDVFAMLST